ncbi:hypothetical protein KY290_017911 [Solanum tuberosum]|uniref:Retrotransposon gag domain-containing protein n=1 Tax=Solanum tuberosum TaxID=4113 RepID=A0ABQ7VCN2_SOLTU|nr:hypothetical protein KY285_016874 [Solanum tuberosum]KAH0761838.1 hypothetical protein KY290_017911 [Solanum tuberosum]
MVNGTRSNGDPSNEVVETVELRDMMQQLLIQVNTLTGKVSLLEKLDQAMINLRNQVTTGGIRGEQSEEGVRRERENNFHSHHSNFSRWSRMEFLRFNGEDLRSWLFKIDQFFSMEGVPAEEKVGVAALQLEGEAIQCHLSFMRYRQFLHPATWNEYVMAMVERFGTDFDDPMEEIKKVKQMGSVKEYQVVFERNLTRVNLSQENAISCFIGGLKHE